MPRIRRIAISQYAHHGYWKAIESVGGTPVEITPSTYVSVFKKCHGVLIPGGRDVSPSWYDAPRHPKTQISDLSRDHFEMTLIRMGMELDMPVLGVCRGHQILNVTAGGTLLQHIHGHEGSSHPVRILESDKLGFIQEDNEILNVNSLHHQSIGELGKDLRVTAVSREGIVEAVEGTKNNWVVGVQWHPEIHHTPRFNRSMAELLDRFVHARKGRAR